jgi:hypothetical protein
MDVQTKFLWLRKPAALGDRMQPHITSDNTQVGAQRPPKWMNARTPSLTNDR